MKNNFIIKSITLLNFAIFLIVISINMFFYIRNDVRNDLIYFISINILCIIWYYIINREYEKELIVNKDNILNLIQIDNEDISNRAYLNKILTTKHNFNENKDNFNMFKRFYIKKNLLKKDYDELKSTFFKFIPQWFVDKVSLVWTERISLWLSTKQYLHVMFLDIIWFTWITEKLDPSKTLLLLNIYFDEIVNIIEKYWWSVDKFLWDWIMAVYWWKDADSILKSAIEIENFVSKFAISEIWRKISISIWINSWEVILWTIWSKNRMEITIIWDNVNIASRLESITRKEKQNIIISESTYNKLLDKESFSLVDLWEREISWKVKKVKIFWVDDIIKYNLD